MKRLYDLVDLVEDNEECVIVKVKENIEPLELIKMGCFDGNETMFRVTKGDDHTATIFRDGGKVFSFHWGIGGYTLVSDSTNRLKRLLVDTIENDFGISLGRYA